MTNENLIMDMLKQMNETMVRMNNNIVDVQETQQAIYAEMAEMKAEMYGMKSEMTEMKVEMNQRFDTIENTLNGIGQQFEETQQRRHESEEHLSNTLKYVTDKILEHDMAIHTLRNKQ